MRTELISTGLSDSRAASRTRSITTQCLLVLGSRSFSHFLNAIERYLQVLHTLSNTPDAKFEVLEIVSTFWRRNRQMILIVFDKLMQYQVVDPTDVVSWAFEGGGLGERGDGLSTFQWELVKIALDKSNGRVSIAQRRVINQRKIDEEAMAKVKAKQAGNEKIDVDDIAMAVDGLLPLLHFGPSNTLLQNLQRQARICRNKQGRTRFWLPSRRQSFPGLSMAS